MIQHLFEKIVATHSDRIVLVQGERQFSYFELHVYVEWMARYFQSLGVQPGHRVAIFMPNVHEFVISVLGLLRLRGIALPLPIDSEAGRIRADLESAKAHAVITIPPFRDLLREVLSSSASGAWPLAKLPLAIFEEDNIATSRGSSLPQLNGAHAKIAFTDDRGNDKPPNGRVLAGKADHDPQENESTAALFFHTRNGRLAVPALYSHHTLLDETDKLVRLSQLTHEDCIFSELPFSQAQGFVAGLVAAVTTGAKMVLAEPAGPDDLVEILGHERVTIYSGALDRFGQLADIASAKLADAPALRLCWCDAASLPSDAEAVLRKNFDTEIQVI